MEFRFEITERIGKISDNGVKTLELNRVSFNGRPAKLDLRRWDRSDPLHPQMLKGITLTDAEAAEAAKLLHRASWAGEF